MYLLNLEIISTKTYHADTSIFVHNISIYKFKNELFVNKDHTSHKSYVDKFQDYARNYANFKD